MSRFRILRVEHFDPESVGRQNRRIYTIYGVIPFLIMMSFNLSQNFGMGYLTKVIISLPFMVLIYFVLLKKVRSNINNLKTIGEIIITQSCIRKNIGDAAFEYPFEEIKEIRLIKHIPATRLSESKNKYFSYILKILLYNQPEEMLVVSDRSLDHNNKISIADTMKTLKKIAPFEVILEL